MFLSPAKRESLGNLKSQSATEILDLGPIPFKETIHFASHSATENKVAQFPEPFEIFLLWDFSPSCSDPGARRATVPSVLQRGKILAVSLRCLNWALGVIYNPRPGCHDWLSLLIIPSRSSGEVYSAIQLQYGVATLGVKSPLTTLDCFMGESRNQDVSLEEGRNWFFRGRSKEARGGDWFLARGEHRAHLTASVL